MEIDQTQIIALDEYDNDTDEEIPPSQKVAVAYLKVQCQKGVPEKLYPLFEGSNVVGRQEDCNVCIPSKALSKQHACIDIRGNCHLLYDSNSRNKTRRGKLFLSPDVRYELKDNDALIFADVHASYVISSAYSAVDCSSETCSESMLDHVDSKRVLGGERLEQTLEVDEESDASSDILQPTQPWTSRMLEPTQRFAPDTDGSEADVNESLTVGETPLHFKKDTSNLSELVLPDSESDGGAANISADPAATLVFEDDTSMDKMDILSAATQAFDRSVAEEESADTPLLPTTENNSEAQPDPPTQDITSPRHTEQDLVKHNVCDPTVPYKMETGGNGSLDSVAGTQSFKISEIVVGKTENSEDRGFAPTQVFEEEDDDASDNDVHCLLTTPTLACDIIDDVQSDSTADERPDLMMMETQAIHEDADNDATQVVEDDVETQVIAEKVEEATQMIGELKPAVVNDKKADVMDEDDSTQVVEDVDTQMIAENVEQATQMIGELESHVDVCKRKDVVGDDDDDDATQVVEDADNTQDIAEHLEEATQMIEESDAVASKKEDINDDDSTQVFGDDTEMQVSKDMLNDKETTKVPLDIMPSKRQKIVDENDATQVIRDESTMHMNGDEPCKAGDNDAVQIFPEDIKAVDEGSESSSKMDDEVTEVYENSTRSTNELSPVRSKRGARVFGQDATLDIGAQSPIFKRPHRLFKDDNSEELTPELNKIDASNAVTKIFDTVSDDETKRLVLEESATLRAAEKRAESSRLTTGKSTRQRSKGEGTAPQKQQIEVFGNDDKPGIVSKSEVAEKPRDTTPKRGVKRSREINVPELEETQVYGRSEPRGFDVLEPTQVYGRDEPEATQVYGRDEPEVTQVYGRDEPEVTQVYGRDEPEVTQVFGIESTEESVPDSHEGEDEPPSPIIPLTRQSPRKSALANPKRSPSPSPKRVNFTVEDKDDKPKKAVGKGRGRGSKNSNTYDNRKKDIPEPSYVKVGKTGRQRKKAAEVISDTVTVVERTSEISEPRTSRRGQRNASKDVTQPDVELTKKPTQGKKTSAKSTQDETKDEKVAAPETNMGRRSSRRKNSLEAKQEGPAKKLKASVEADRTVVETITKKMKDSGKTVVPEAAKNLNDGMENKEVAVAVAVGTKKLKNKVETEKKSALPETSVSKRSSRGRKSEIGTGAEVVSVGPESVVSTSNNNVETEKQVVATSVTKKFKVKVETDKKSVSPETSVSKRSSRGRQNEIGTGAEVVSVGPEIVVSTRPSRGRKSLGTTDKAVENKSDMKEEVAEVSKRSSRGRKSLFEEKTDEKEDNKGQTGGRTAANKDKNTENDSVAVELSKEVNTNLTVRSTPETSRKGRIGKVATVEVPAVTSPPTRKGKASRKSLTVGKEHVEDNSRSLCASLESDRSESTPSGSSRLQEASDEGRQSGRASRNKGEVDSSVDVNASPSSQGRISRASVRKRVSDETKVSPVAKKAKSGVNPVIKSEHLEPVTRRSSKRAYSADEASLEAEVPSVKRGRKLALNKSESESKIVLSRSQAGVKSSQSLENVPTASVSPASTKRKKVAKDEKLPEAQSPVAAKKIKKPEAYTPTRKLQEVRSSSPILRRKSTEPKPKVVFTGVVDEQGQKVVKDLGGDLAASIHECTHLVTDKVRRTVKFLGGLSRGVPIVTPLWLFNSKSAGIFLDSSKFIVADKVAEKQYKFSLKKSIDKAAKENLLQGYKIHVTKSVRPDPTQMKDILLCAGAEYLPTMPKKSDDRVLILSCPEDKALVMSALKAGISVVSAEFVLTGVLKQLVDVVSYRLFTDEETNPRRSRTKSAK